MYQTEGKTEFRNAIEELSKVGIAVSPGKKSSKKERYMLRINGCNSGAYCSKEEVILLPWRIKAILLKGAIEDYISAVSKVLKGLRSAV